MAAMMAMTATIHQRKGPRQRWGAKRRWGFGVGGTGQHYGSHRLAQTHVHAVRDWSPNLLVLGANQLPSENHATDFALPDDVDCFFAGALGACSLKQTAPPLNLQPEVAMRTITIRAQVPAGVGRSIAPAIVRLGNWNPNIFAMTAINQERTAVLRLPVGTPLNTNSRSVRGSRGLGPSSAISPISG